MKVRMIFDFHAKEATWWRTVADFPKAINFMGKNFKWIGTRLQPGDGFDAEFIFSETSTWDAEHYEACSKYSSLFPETVSGCECGAIYTSFPKHHMFFCRLWSKN